MESSEDDAGAATDASRRASAREKDVGGCEDVAETSSVAEEAFDGDSVPSPLAHDVNTSTEALLDMIDEIVDGPGAPRRLPLISELLETEFARDRGPTSRGRSLAATEQPSVSPPTTTESENVPQESPVATQAECIVHSDTVSDINSVTNAANEVNSSIDLPQTSSSVLVETTEPNSSIEPPVNDVLSCIETLPTSVSEPNDANDASSIESVLESSVPTDTISTDTNSSIAPIQASSTVLTEITLSDHQSIEPSEASSSVETAQSDSNSVCIEPSQEISSADCTISKDANRDSMELLQASSSLHDASDPSRSIETPQASTSEPIDTTACTDSIAASSQEPSQASPPMPITTTSDPNSGCIEHIQASSSVHIETEPSDHSVFVEPPQASSSMPIEPNNQIELQASSSMPPEEPPQSPQESAEADTEAASEPNIPSSSVVETISVSESDSQSERTIKFVTSSASRDNVTVESAESTSSDSSISESRAAAEAATRSPLRRRLVRPGRSERRPDSTVSSTVDSNTTNVHTTEQSSESIAKDVSSSSDAVYANVKPEEISVSEISVCKAETSMCPPKKIKLIRQKVTPVVRDGAVERQDLTTESEQCQSTSSESLPSVSPEPGTSNSLEITSRTKSEEVVSELSIECAKPTIQTPHETPTETPHESIVQEPQAVIESHENEPQESVDNAHASQTLKESLECHKESDEKKVPPIKLNLTSSSSADACPESKADSPAQPIASSSNEIQQDSTETAKQVPKLTIKLGSKTEEMKSPIPKLTIRPIRAHTQNEGNKSESSAQVPSVTKLNIKPVIRPAEINDIHRKSSSSEISESESSENDDTSTSDQTSASDQGPSAIVPKVTIKLGKPGTESEGKFYTEKNVPKLTIKGILNTDNVEEEAVSKLKIKISQSEDKQPEKIPKLTIKTVAKSEGQPLSPKLTIKPLKPPDTHKESLHIDSFTSTVDIKDIHFPKITIKPVVKTDSETMPKTPRKSTAVCDSAEHIPVVTKLNIKPVLKPVDEASGSLEEKLPVISKLNIKPILKPVDCAEQTDKVEDKVPVVSKLNIKPILKPVDFNEAENVEVIPIVSKINIKPIVKPTNSRDTSDDLEEKVPIVSKLNIKPILKPTESDSESADDNIPVVAKLNIKPILKPTGSTETSESLEDKVPVVSKLNIKPILKPKDNEVDSSIEDVPKITKLNIKPLKNPEEKSSDAKDCDELNADNEQNSIPIVTKLNIKPVVKPREDDTIKDSENQSSETSSDDNGDIPVVTKINIKPILRPSDAEPPRPNISNEQSIPVVTKLNIKPLIKPEDNKSHMSPKKDTFKSGEPKSPVPIVTKLNIKPIVKPDDVELKSENEDTSVRNPPLVMKINMKSKVDMSSNEGLSNTEKRVNSIDNTEHICNNVSEAIPVVSKLNIKPITKPLEVDTTEKVTMNCKPSSSHSPLSKTIKQNCLPDSNEGEISINDPKPSLIDEKIKTKLYDLVSSKRLQGVVKTDKTEVVCNEVSGSSGSIQLANANAKATVTVDSVATQTPRKQSSAQNCTLLKKLLEAKKDGLDNRLEEAINANHSPGREATPISKGLVNSEHDTEKVNSEASHENEVRKSPIRDKMHRVRSPVSAKLSPSRDLTKETSESLTKPLEINISDKYTNQSSGQDSPRIIIKINKTDHGPSAKIITEEAIRPNTPEQNDMTENTQEMVNDKQQKKNTVNSRKKALADKTPTVLMGKRLRSSRIVEEKSPAVKKNIGKRPSTTDISPPQSKESELTVLESKRLKLGQLLSNKSLTVTPIPSKPQPSPPKPNSDFKQGAKTVNHSLLNNENCSKNGNSKLHNILSNLQAKQARALAFSELKCAEKVIAPEESSTSSDVVEIVPLENSHQVEIVINVNSESRDMDLVAEDVSEDPLDTSKVEDVVKSPVVPELLTPQPKKRGRPRKLPVSEGAKPVPTPVPVALPVPALEERPQRSLRLSRDRPAILVKPRGRGRGRGIKRVEPTPPKEEPPIDTATKFFVEEKPEDIDPTSSRIKLPRMTEALDKMPAVCSTPLSSRRRSSTASDLKLFADGPELKAVFDTLPSEVTPEAVTPSGRGRGRGRGGRGRGGRGRGRGRGRGGGRGAMYMKETMGIYGRVCGPATTTVQLFEEETCMMDDNATPAKPSHLLDEDSQSSVKSSTNESSKTKKSKFADLFDSNKVWTAADVKEYEWPPTERPDVEHQIMMIQEQVAMFLGVKSFKRRYPELKRRTVAGEEREYVLGKGLVTEALCDLGITAVEASEVLDIMLSDYPHKYEEYRAHQRERQRAEPAEEPAPEVKVDKTEKVEVKVEVKIVEPKPEPSKVDLEKSRQDMAAAAVASAGDWNARLNASRRPACVDLQTLTVHRRRPAPAAAPAPRVRPPHGFYPHALLPGQYQHHYRTYTSEQLRYFPLSTAVCAPATPPSPAPSSSDSEPDCSTSADDSPADALPPKRKKLTKTKRSSHTDGDSRGAGAGAAEDVSTCRACGLRLEANRKHTHERFLVCATCNAKLHPGCVELCADTVRKCREYAWQCSECKTCGRCARADPQRLLCCDLCDRGYHAACIGLRPPHTGRWHCVECAICKSCGARDPGGLPAAGAVPGPSTPGVSTPGGSVGSVSTPGGAEWHHQTKRGPGGHKVYSHSLCTPCARAYRIGRYCPLCERSFVGPKGTMRIVICKLCDRQHHQDCVKQGARALQVLDYTCAECRRGGITSRAAAARLAPRTIATLFMAKRRFNKYAHRQYLASRQQAKAASETSNDAAESCEPPDRTDDASDASDPPDPLDITDETTAAVNSLRDFGD